MAPVAPGGSARRECACAGRAPGAADKGACSSARDGGRSGGRAGTRRREAEPRGRDGAQPGRAPALEPEHRVEREPKQEPQPQPAPGRGRGPQGRAARSGGARAPQRLSRDLQPRTRLPGPSARRPLQPGPPKSCLLQPHTSRHRATQLRGGSPPCCSGTQGPPNLGQRDQILLLTRSRGHPKAPGPGRPSP